MLVADFLKKNSKRKENIINENQIN